jgi:hypothetical protein
MAADHAAALRYPALPVGTLIASSYAIAGIMDVFIDVASLSLDVQKHVEAASLLLIHLHVVSASVVC